MFPKYMDLNETSGQVQGPTMDFTFFFSFATKVNLSLLCLLINLCHRCSCHFNSCDYSDHVYVKACDEYIIPFSANIPEHVFQIIFF